MLKKSFVNNYKDLTPPWGPIGYVVYKRTYSRNGEEWYQTLERVCNGLLEIGGIFNEPEIEKLYDYMFNLKGCVSGRALWQLGSETVRRLGGDSLQNCWFVANDELKAFQFLFDELMLGGGVGFSILPENVYKLPTVRFKPSVVRVDENDCDFIIPDNREGWVEFLGRVLDSYFFTGKRIHYSTTSIRSKGAKINSFGGVASGPEDLVTGIHLICSILDKKLNNNLRPVDVLDINNILGKIVVAGNVRRSAELALGDSSDLEYMNAKMWSKQKIPSWRQQSNNSIWADTFENIPELFWDGYNGKGEPYGLVNLKNFRRFGRIIDGVDYRPDYGIKGVNPCAEIGLEPYECCNLAEIFLPNLEDADEFLEVARLLYMAQKTISCLHYSHPETEAIVKKNHRLGLSVTGFLQAPFLRQSEIFDGVYRFLEEYDKSYSEMLGVTPSKKLTTVKPSGTLSLLPGVTPGVNPDPACSQYYIRRVQFDANDPLVEVAKNHGFSIEPKINLDGSFDFSSMVVSFPIATPPGTTVNPTAIEQLENAKFLQTWWADNSVSITVNYEMKELPEIKEWLKENYNSNLKTVSFLLKLGHGFQQAPYEPISQEKYRELADKTTPIQSFGGNFSIEIECTTKSCPTK